MKLTINVFVYCVISSIYLFATLAINPRIWMHRMPKAVTEKVEPRTKRERTLLIILGVPFVVYTVAHPTIYAYIHATDVLPVIGSIFTFLLVFDLWDTMILDLLVFCRITPRFIIIKGTEKGDYRETRSHIVGGIKGIVLAVISSIVLGVIVFLIERIV